MYRVLIVDDEPQITEGFLLLIDWNATAFNLVDTCGNGVDALRMIEKTPYDLLITDIRMPEMDGLQLIERATALRPALLSIIVSGYNEFDFARRAIQLSSIDYLLKPVAAEDLLGVLENAEEQLERRQKSDRESWEITRHLLKDLFRNRLTDIDQLQARLSSNGPFCLFLLKMEEEWPPSLKETYVFPVEAGFVGGLFFAGEETWRDKWTEIASSLNAQAVPILRGVAGPLLTDCGQLHRAVSALRMALAQGGEKWRIILDFPATESTPQSIRPVIAYVNENYRQNMTLKELAQKFYINPAYLGVAFKRALGVKYNKYIMNLRIQDACRHLDEGMLDVSEIAALLGYSDINYFYRQFKQVARMTTGEYREKRKVRDAGLIL